MQLEQSAHFRNHTPAGTEPAVQPWINGFLLLCLIAGQAEILVAIVNRSHSFPVQSGLLRQFRHMHDVLMVLFPLTLVAWVGFYDPGVLVGGTWAELTWPWLIVCAICTAGLVSLVACSIRWQLRKPPRCQISTTSTVVDIGSEHGEAAVGQGEYQSLTRVPGNEFLKLEVAEKVYEASVVGQELSILHLTDFHFTGIPGRLFYETAIDTVMQREHDIVVFTGDLIDEPSLLSWFPTTLGRLKARLGCYYILGNHDWSIGDRGARTMFDDHGWISVAGKVVSVPGTNLVMGGSEYPWMGQNPDFDTIGTPNDARRILLSHTPDNLTWAKANNVALMLSGHNHGGQVVLPVFGPIYSPSWYGVRHASGDFFEPPTLLHVCRGIGARHPLRLNCLPEIATLVFRNPVA